MADTALPVKLDMRPIQVAIVSGLRHWYVDWKIHNDEIGKRKDGMGVAQSQLLEFREETLFLRFYTGRLEKRRAPVNTGSARRCVMFLWC